MYKRLKRWWWTKYYTWTYRKHDRNVCCCGDYIDRHENPMNCGHSPVSEVDYAIYCAVERKMNNA